MAISETLDAQFACLEVYLSWTALCEEFNSPEEWKRIDKIKWLKGEEVYEALKDELKIPPGSDPFTVAKTVGDYLTKIGYAKFNFIKISDTEMMYDRADMNPMIIFRKVKAKGMKVIPPEPSHALFVGALKKVCNVEPEIIEIPPPDYVKSLVPPGGDMGREMWRVSPRTKLADSQRDTEVIRR